jgi:hypothetical protein
MDGSFTFMGIEIEIEMDRFIDLYKGGRDSILVFIKSMYWLLMDSLMDYNIEKRERGRDGFIADSSCTIQEREKETLLIVIDSLNISIRHGFHSCRL